MGDHASVIAPGLYLQDPDFTLYVGDAFETLRTLQDGSVDCCVTSPPYWGLRDYGTGEWEGGDEGCDHRGSKPSRRAAAKASSTLGESKDTLHASIIHRDVCHCGARRIDRQLGLEPTPDEFVANMVAVFREVRRVLAAHGTCWVNLGDSYASGEVGRNDTPYIAPALALTQKDRSLRRITQRTGLKPKDLVGIPWRVAFALQADGWYLRSDIIWAKPNPMPESVTDRPTKAHEYVFLLTKRPRYWFDQEAVREKYDSGNMRNGFRGENDGPSAYVGQQGPQSNSAKGPDGRRVTSVLGQDGSLQHRDGERWPNGGRNVRSVWEIATQPYPEAHFATFPEELARRCIVAGCPESVCRVCGKARERIVERTRYEPPVATDGERFVDASRGDKTRKLSGADYNSSVKVLGESWSDCGHGDYLPGVVLDPFMGSGTVAYVARKHGRACVGIELSTEYCELIARRTAQLSMLAGGGSVEA